MIFRFESKKFPLSLNIQLAPHNYVSYKQNGYLELVTSGLISDWKQ